MAAIAIGVQRGARPEIAQVGWSTSPTDTLPGALRRNIGLSFVGWLTSPVRPSGTGLEHSRACFVRWSVSKSILV